eukprot:3941388-Rhodomonas_salina.4
MRRTTIAAYAMPGPRHAERQRGGYAPCGPTGIAYGTALVYGASDLSVGWYAACGTGLGYGGMRCAVLGCGRGIPRGGREVTPHATHSELFGRVQKRLPVTPHAQSSLFTPHAQSSLFTPHAQSSLFTPHAQSSFFTPYAQSSLFTPHAQSSLFTPHTQSSPSTPHAQSSLLPHTLSPHSYPTRSALTVTPHAQSSLLPHTPSAHPQGMG